MNPDDTTTGADPLDRDRLSGRATDAGDDGLRRVSQPSLAEVAAGELRNMIVRGTLAPGTRLVEADLCEALGISRTPLRDALKTLASEGLVKLRRNRNSIVAPMDVEQLRHLFEVEAELEALAAGLATQRMTDRDFDQLESLQARLESPEVMRDRDAYFELNQQIHSSIVAAAKNPILEETHRRLLGRLVRARYAALDSFGRQEASVLEHRRILEALEARDAGRVSALMKDHVNHTGHVIMLICDGLAGRG